MWISLQFFLMGRGRTLPSPCARLKLGRNPDLSSLSLYVITCLSARGGSQTSFLSCIHSALKKMVFPFLAALTNPTIQKLTDHQVLGGFKAPGLRLLTPPSPSLAPTNEKLVSFGLGYIRFPHFLPSTEVLLFSENESLANTALIKSTFPFCKFWENLNRYRPHNNWPEMFPEESPLI